jgi:hypothetical protein
MKKIKVNVQPNEISVKLKGTAIVKKEPLFQKLKSMFEETISKIRQSADIKKDNFVSVLNDIESILSTKDLRESQTIPQMDMPKPLQNKTADTLQSMIYSFLNTRSSLVSGAAAASLHTKTQNCIRLIKMKDKLIEQNKTILDFVTEISSDQIKTQFQDEYLEPLQLIQTYLKADTLDLDELIRLALQSEDVEKHKIEENCLEELFLNEIKYQKTLRKIFDLQKQRSALVQAGDLDVSEFDTKIRILKQESKKEINILKSQDSESDEDEKTKRNVQWDETLHFDDDEKEFKCIKEMINILKNRISYY